VNSNPYSIYIDPKATPNPRQDAALAVLNYTAECLAPALFPIAGLAPYQWVCGNGLVSRAADADAGTAQTLKFPCDGLLVGILVSVRSTTADLIAQAESKMLLQVLVDGDSQLFPSITGGGAAFMSFAQIKAQMFAMGGIITRRPFTAGNPWTFFVDNTQAATDLTYDIAFAIVNASTPKT
jgi:hypothetical protein